MLPMLNASHADIRQCLLLSNGIMQQAQGIRHTAFKLAIVHVLWNEAIHTEALSIVRLGIFGAACEVRDGTGGNKGWHGINAKVSGT